MKRLILAIAAAATTLFAPAAVTQQLDFESNGTAYESAARPSATANYPFADFGSKYLELDDTFSAQGAGGTVFDMYVQFTVHEDPSLGENDKLGICLKSNGNLIVLGEEEDELSLESQIAENTWHRLTLVQVQKNDKYGFNIYLDGNPLVGVLDKDVFYAKVNEASTSVKFEGSGKLDNFVARTTDPFGGAPTGWIAKVGDDPEQYYTNYTAALTAALNGASLTFSDSSVMDGSAAHPFEIRTAADLQALADAVNAGKSADKCFVQTADIDMTGAGAFAGIGVYNANPTAGTPFTGTYDGGNFTISNVTMTARNYGGIFNQVNGGTIKNLTVENILTAATSGEFGYAIVGNAGNGATLENLTAAGSFLSAEKPGTHNMAGIVVRACGGGENGTLVKNCTNAATIYGAYTKMAGVCAIAQHKIDGGAVTFDGCVNSGTLTMPSGATAGRDGLAGIIGYVNDDTVLKGCSNTGTMTSTLETAKVGQLVGWAYNSVLTFEDAGTIAANGPAKIGDFGSTVVLDWAISGTEGNNFDFNVYGKTGSTVEIAKAFTGFPPQYADIAPTLKLSADMTINNGWSDQTNATFTAITGSGTLTVTHTYNYVKYYRIKSLENFTGTLASGMKQVGFIIDDIAKADAAFGTAVVKGTNVKVYDLESTTLNGTATALCVDTVNSQNGIYLVAAEVVADDESTTDFASVEAALDAADAALASTVNVLDPDAVEVVKTGWSYDNGVYTSTRAIATLKGTNYPSLTKALAAAAEDDEVVLVGATSESVTIPAGVTVAVTDGVAFNGTVAGAGAVKFTAAQTGTIKFGEWTGTVTLDWAGIVNAGDIAPVMTRYGKEGSTVEIGSNGTITGTSYFNTAPVATLKVSGFVSIDNGSSYTEQTIPTVTGDGVLVFGASGARVNYRITNLVDWNGVITNSSSNAGIANITSGSGKVVYASTPDIAPTVGEGYTGEVYLNFNYSNYNVASYGGVNATRFLGTMTGYLHDAAGESGQTGIVAGKTVVSGDVVINNGWTQYPDFNWTGSKTVQFDDLTVDGSFSLVSAQSSWNSAYCYYYARSLNGDGAGAITVGNNFALRIDAVDFATAPSGENALVNLTLTGDKPGLLYGPNGVAGETIPVTVNGEATEQSLVYDATKGGLVLYVPATPKATYDGTDYMDVVEALSTAYMARPTSFGKVVTVLDENWVDTGAYAEFFAWDSVARTYTVITYPARIAATYYSTLAAALDAAVDGNTIVLVADTAVTEMQLVTKSVTLDLNGFAITAGERTAEAATAGDDSILCVLHGGSLTINDTSAGSTGAITGNSVFTSAVKMTKKGDTDDTKKAVLVVNGGTLTGYYYGISGNGSAGRGNTEVTINGGSVYGSCTDDSVAIFQPQLGTLTINGGYLEGAMGVYVKSGTATVAINGGTIKGNGTYAAYVFRGGGFNNTGDAFVVDNAGYPGGAPAPSILGGTFVSVNASAIASYAKTGLARIVHFADKDAVTITEAKASSEDVFLEKGFPGGADGKTFTIDDAVQTALEAKLPAGKALTDTVEGTTSGLTYAQAYALDLFDEDTGTVEDVKPTIEIVNGKVVVSLDATAKAGYKVMLNVYEKSSLTTQWPTEPTKSYELDSEAEAAGFAPSAAGAGFYKVGVTIEDAE